MVVVGIGVVVVVVGFGVRVRVGDGIHSERGESRYDVLGPAGYIGEDGAHHFTDGI